jgi:hypothetical protein
MTIDRNGRTCEAPHGDDVATCDHGQTFDGPGFDLRCGYCMAVTSCSHEGIDHEEPHEDTCEGF